MRYTIYRFKFPVGVHFGDGALWDSANTLHADTLFSALCIEALHLGGETQIDNLVTSAKSGALLLSDMFPFAEDEYFLPKPYVTVERESSGDSVEKKKFKKLKYIPVSKWSQYFTNDFDPGEAVEKLDNAGKFSIRTMSALRSPDKIESGDALPFSVGVYNFAENSGLYLIAGYNDEAVKNTLDELLRSLAFSGLGGKKSSGLGRFELEECALPDELKSPLNSGKAPAVTLSVCMATRDEIDEALEDAKYSLIRRGGFIDSYNYAPELRRKRDFYSFGAGSCFEKRFTGDVFDVGAGGKHPVYRYCKPMWMEI